MSTRSPQSFGGVRRIEGLSMPQSPFKEIYPNRVQWFKSLDNVTVVCCILSAENARNVVTHFVHRINGAVVVSPFSVATILWYCCLAAEVGCLQW